MRTAKKLVWTTDDPVIPVVITYSSPMSAAEFAELEQVIELWLKQLRREVAQPLTAMTVVAGQSTLTMASGICNLYGGIEFTVPATPSAAEPQKEE